MTISARTLSEVAGLRSATMRRLALALGAVIALLLTAAPAGAFISGEFGLQQRKPVWVRHGPLQYHNGKVIHASDSYAIYWDPLELYNSEWMRLIDGYFRNVGAASGSLGNVFALNAQYGEAGYGTGPAASALAKEAHAASQSTFRGAYTATDSYPSSGNCTEPAGVVCLTDQEIKTELQKVIKSGALPGTTGTVPGARSTPVYYILTPPGVTVCAGASSPSTCSNSATLETEAQEIKEAKVAHHAETGICGYHSAINPGGATPVVYAVQPWVAGYAGLFAESGSPLTTTGTSADVLACQDNSVLEEPNQLSGQNPFAYFGAGLADVIIGDLANEQSNIVVNPLLNGWYQNASAAEQGFPEQGDMCQFDFGPPPKSPPTPNPETHAASVSNEGVGGGSYYLHWAFNSAGFLTGKDTAGCWQGATLEPHITAPNPVNVGDVIGLDANESGITLDPAPLGPRQQKEETRLAEEILALNAEETRLGNEIKKLGEEETRLGNEIQKLGEEEKTLAQEEKALAEERKAKEPLSEAEEEEFAKKEKRLASRRERLVKAKTAAESAKASDEARKSIAEKEKRTDAERKTITEEDKLIVTGDKQIAKEELTLAKEHMLIKEREPFLAPIYKWDFGYQESGKEVTEEGEEKASVFHAFPCAKTYVVGLTVVDGGGYERSLPESVIKTITVEGGKPCVEPAGSGAGGSGTGGSGTGGGSGATSGVASPGSSTQAPPPAAPAKPPVLGPVATASALSSSLTKVTRKGLSIAYSVNQQATGHLEVLLVASLAQRIGLRGPLAAGLPQGMPPQVAIAKALVITTRAGRGTLRIQFGKITAKRLRRLRSVPLTLRLSVRNAGGGTTTVISALTLH
ncbi:MAG TPA: hypothetical protein VNY27_07985 [Solirubrobacteraceae bacterium]|nr:hypothetical protein [Solirubrobacteraceae bacterium]